MYSKMYDDYEQGHSIPKKEIIYQNKEDEIL